MLLKEIKDTLDSLNLAIKKFGKTKFLSLLLFVLILGIIATSLFYENVRINNIERELNSYKNFLGIKLSDNERDLALLSPLELRIKTLELSQKILKFSIEYEELQNDIYSGIINKKNLEDFNNNWDKYTSYSDSINLNIFKKSKILEDSLLAKYNRTFGTEPARYRSYILKLLNNMNKEYKDLNIYSEHDYLHPVRIVQVQRISFQLDALARRLPQIESIPIPNIFK